MDNYLNGKIFSSFLGGNPPINIPCMDQLFLKYMHGNLTEKREDIIYLRTCLSLSVSNELKNPVVIILESPHKNEFVLNNGAWQAVGPASGTTGRLFKKEFMNLIKTSKIGPYLLSLTDFDVVLINAVQFQCSLGASLNNDASILTKDKYWIDCFTKGCGKDMRNRIKAIKPKAVINLCTKGIMNLQLFVHDLVKGSVKYYTTGSHPSTWWNSYKAYIL